MSKQHHNETKYVTPEEMSRVVANTMYEYTDDGMIWDQVM